MQFVSYRRRPRQGKRYLLERIAATRLAAFSAFEQLAPGTSWPILRARRSSDDAEQDIGARNGVLNVAGLLQFCAGSSGFVVTLYDQAGGSKDVTQATKANQPRIVNAGVLDVNAGGRPVLTFDGADFLSRPDGLGLTGSPAVSIASCWATAATGADPWGLGSTAGTDNTRLGQFINSSTQMYFEQGGQGRLFTVSNPATFSSYLCTLTAATPTSSAVGSLMYQNEATATPVSTLGATALNMANNITILGANVFGAGSAIACTMNMWIAWNAVLSTDERTLLFQHQQRHRV